MEVIPIYTIPTFLQRGGKQKTPRMWINNIYMAKGVGKVGLALTFFLIAITRARFFIGLFFFLPFLILFLCSIEARADIGKKTQERVPDVLSFLTL